jgi:hypothetical protein
MPRTRVLCTISLCARTNIASILDDMVVSRAMRLCRPHRGHCHDDAGIRGDGAVLLASLIDVAAAAAAAAALGPARSSKRSRGRDTKRFSGEAASTSSLPGIEQSTVTAGGSDTVERGATRDMRARKFNFGSCEQGPPRVTRSLGRYRYIRYMLD